MEDDGYYNSSKVRSNGNKKGNTLVTTIPRGTAKFLDLKVGDTLLWKGEHKFESEFSDKEYKFIVNTKYIDKQDPYRKDPINEIIMEKSNDINGLNKKINSIEEELNETKEQYEILKEITKIENKEEIINLLEVMTKKYLKLEKITINYCNYVNTLKKTIERVELSHLKLTGLKNAVFMYVDMLSDGLIDKKQFNELIDKELKNNGISDTFKVEYKNDDVKN